MKNWWFPIAAYVVSCPTRTKNLEWYLFYRVSHRFSNNFDSIFLHQRIKSKSDLVCYKHKKFVLTHHKSLKRMLSSRSFFIQSLKQLLWEGFRDDWFSKFMINGNNYGKCVCLFFLIHIILEISKLLTKDWTHSMYYRSNHNINSDVIDWLSIKVISRVFY